jgi:multidrug resistance efflux pump
VHRASSGPAADVAQAQLTAAAAQQQRARAALHQVQLNLSMTAIRSPIDGVVVSRSVDVGQTVAASLQAPNIFTLAEDLRKMQVEVERVSDRRRPDQPSPGSLRRLARAKGRRDERRRP